MGKDDLQTEENLIKNEEGTQSIDGDYNYFHATKDDNINEMTKDQQQAMIKKKLENKDKFNKKLLQIKEYKDFLDEMEEIRNIEEGLEIDVRTATLYHKLQFEEGMCAFYTFAAIVTSCISYEGKKTNIGENKIINYQIFTLVVVSVLNILFCKFFK